MKIGALAAQTGLSCSRIRYYERIGLLKAVERLPNGYRIYLDEAVVILKLIVVAQEAGFTLEEMQRLIPPDLGSWDRDLLARTLAAKTVFSMEASADAAALKQRGSAFVQRSRFFARTAISGDPRRPQSFRYRPGPVP